MTEAVDHVVFMKAVHGYKVAQCPKCGEIQVTGAEKALKCKMCGKTTQFRNSRGTRMVRILETLPSPVEASVRCRAIKASKTDRIGYEGN